MLRQMRPAPSSADRLRRRIDARRQKRLEQCESASRPVAAVSQRGSPSVSSGSRDRTLRDEMRADEAELAPIRQRQAAQRARPPRRCPAVVGIAMTGATDGADLRNAAVDRRVSFRAGRNGSRAAPRPSQDRSASRRRPRRSRRILPTGRSRARRRPRPRSGWAACRGSAARSQRSAQPPRRAGRPRRCRGR